jgi:antibiotic biosynthesis monooxygenase (ABM) superfamily enzyme
MLLLFSFIFKDQLASLPLFWRVLITTATMTPILSFVCIPVITRLLRGWLQPAQPTRGVLWRVAPRWRLNRR